MGNFKEDISKIKAFIFDVDGVFTDGGIIPMSDGDFIRKYNAKDGYAIAYALKKGYKVAIITGGRGANLETRFKLLGVTTIYTNCSDKLTVLKQFMKEHDLDRSDVLFMGDDIPDLESMMYVEMPVAPNDAVIEIIEVARYISQFNGGHGCVRDIVEQVLRANDDWAKDSHGVTCVPSA